MCGLGCRASKEVTRRSGEYDFSAVRAAARPHVDDPVRLRDKFKAMFDDDDRVAVIAAATDAGEAQCARRGAWSMGFIEAFPKGDTTV